jgi:hypothetical protein
VLHNGWWLVTSVYLVVDAGLTPSELVLIGVAQGSLVASHVLMGAAMIATGLVTDFGPLVATQMLWGLSWTFASGADVAWITDELDEPARISGVLVRYGRAQLTGAAAGILGLGALGSVIERSTAMVIAGAAMLLLGLYVVVRFREERFVPAPTRRWAASWSILARGWDLVRRSRAILLMFAATFLVNGAWNGFGRLRPLKLVDLGLPTDPVAWFTGLGVLTLLAGAAALRFVEARIDDAGTALRGYAIACGAGAVGALALAAAPEELSGSAAVLLVAGIAMPLTRTLATIWVNQQTTSEVRATVHSFLAQAEYLGEIACGLAIAAIAWVAGLTSALLACGALFALTVLFVQRLAGSRPARGR